MNVDLECPITDYEDRSFTGGVHAIMHTLRTRIGTESSPTRSSRDTTPDRHAIVMPTISCLSIHSLVSAPGTDPADKVTCCAQMRKCHVPSVGTHAHCIRCHATGPHSKFGSLQPMRVKPSEHATNRMLGFSPGEGKQGGRGGARGGCLHRRQPWDAFVPCACLLNIAPVEPGVPSVIAASPWGLLVFFRSWPPPAPAGLASSMDVSSATSHVAGLGSGGSDGCRQLE